MSIIVRKSGKEGFRVLKRVFIDGKPKEEAVPKLAWQELGFNPEMSFDQAKERASRLNKETTLDKERQRKVSKAAKRVELERVIDSVYIPKPIAEEFVVYLKENFLKRRRSNTKLLSHWQKAQQVIAETKLLPTAFAENKGKLVGYFLDRQLSMNYAKKIFRVLNLWGSFLCKIQGQYFEPIPAFDDYDAELLTDTYSESERYIGPSKAITPIDLIALKANLTPEQIRWLSFTVWFGLRPSEVNALRGKTNPARIEWQDGTPILVVYQPKLVRLKKEDRWKYIPAWHLSQQKLINEIDLPMKAPLVKTLKKYLHKEQVGLYGGRKGFEDLMRSFGQSFEHVSAWLGHASIDRTWRIYRKRNAVGWTKLTAV